MSESNVEILPKKGQRGAPSRYKPEYAERLLAFFGVEQREVWVQEKFYESKFEEKGSLKERRPEIVMGAVPTFEDFAWEIGVVTQTLINWATALNPDGTPKNPEFLVAYVRAHERQRALYIRYGGNGTINPAFAMMMLKNNHGFDGVSRFDMLMAGISDFAAQPDMTEKEPESKPLELSPRYQRLKALTEKASGS